MLQLATKKTAAAVETTAVKKKPTLTDDTLIVVRSATFGELIYVNHKTGERTTWKEYGETQVMTMRDLRDMRAGNVAFYENNWIFIVGIESTGFEDVTPYEIYEALFVQKYYKNTLDLDNFDEICGWNEKKIKDTVPMFSENAKFNLVIALNGYIKGGQLDSLRKIKCFEDVLHCELERP